MTPNRNYCYCTALLILCFEWTTNKESFFKRTFKGDYKTTATDRPNTVKTETSYAKRIIFFAKTFEPFNKYKDDDDFSWILN